MGLDSYGVTVAKEFAGNCQVDIRLTDSDWKPFKEADADLNFAHWKNFYCLHAWMAALYYKKGGSGHFNGDLVRLELADLERLEKAMMNGEFKAVCADEELFSDDIDEIMNFISRSRKVISEGYAVFYDSWW